MSGRKLRGLTLAPLVAATYFMVSGGPYGLEELIAKAGYQNALWILIITPLIWSLPTALMVGELSGALPEAGGYYVWVRRALGRFWGFQEAWLSLIASIFDMAIYPTLFVLYLGCLFPSLGTGAPAIAVGAAMIGVCALWNLTGTRVVGGSSLLMGVLLLSPFALMVILSGAHPVLTAPAVRSSEAGLFAGISVAMWNLMGWDNASTVARDVENPARTYPLAMLITVLLVTVTYVLPVMAARRAGLDPNSWTTGAWVTAADVISGGWLGTAVVIGGMLSAIGTFNSLVMSYSQVPVALADDGLFPRIFARRTARVGSPWVSILVCSAAYACCLGLGFSRLVLLDVLVYGLSLLLEFVALVVLRIREPQLPRLFRVPGGLGGAIAVGVLPMALLIAALFSSGDAGGASSVTLALGLGLAYLGPLIYWARERYRSVPALQVGARQNGKRATG
jgi:amino acid transporter